MVINGDWATLRSCTFPISDRISFESISWQWQLLLAYVVENGLFTCYKPTLQGLPLFYDTKYSCLIWNCKCDYSCFITTSSTTFARFSACHSMQNSHLAQVLVMWWVSYRFRILELRNRVNQNDVTPGVTATKSFLKNFSRVCNSTF